MLLLLLVLDVVPVSVPWGLISLLFLDTKKWAHLQDLINYTFKRLLNRPQVTARLEKLFYLCFVDIKNRSLNSFAGNMIKLSVSNRKQNGVVCYLGTSFLSFNFDFYIS